MDFVELKQREYQSRSAGLFGNRSIKHLRKKNELNLNCSHLALESID